MNLRPTDSARPSSGLIVVPFRHGPFWNFTYLVACATTGEAAVIDPAWDVEAVIDASRSRGLRISTVLLTHGHSDHSHGTADVVGRTGAAVLVHSAELPELRRHYEGPVVELAGDEDLRLGDVPLRILHTPGHSEGSVSILGDGQLFTGDMLAVGSVGRPGPGPEALEALWTTVDRVLRPLHGDTIIRPGHDAGPSPSSPLGEELVRVPALAARTFSDFERELRRGAAWQFPA
jgi:hydroxyacylglutathione hydrolase